MPSYKVIKTSLIDGRIVHPGATVDYDGNPGSNLEPTDKEGEKRKADYAELKKPKTSEERLGAAIAEGITNPPVKSKKASKVDPTDTPTVTTPAPGDTLTTTGTTTVPQKSAGGVDADAAVDTAVKPAA